jgi:hypothetical protein
MVVALKLILSTIPTNTTVRLVSEKSLKLVAVVLE